MTLHYKTARMAAGALLALSACANLAQVAPGTPLADVQARFGRPNFECPQANGGRRVIWTQQPMGQYAWGANVGTDGKVDRVLPLLTDPHFKVLETGTWPGAGALRIRPAGPDRRGGLGEARSGLVLSLQGKQRLEFADVRVHGPRRFGRDAFPSWAGSDVRRGQVHVALNASAMKSPTTRALRVLAAKGRFHLGAAPAMKTASRRFFA